jgi:hypothetical protein
LNQTNLFAEFAASLKAASLMRQVHERYAHRQRASSHWSTGQSKLERVRLAIQ